ncbi:hypothetical protein Taro_000068 [Colocasia esculenta]|uniref:Uncharacterized protein n=1 Tax=Colocasia esculenta TaxID=4460 RepID=A0A843TBV5_COLES|nr:hypothetical protein [Colocasia esculenta]
MSIRRLRCVDTTGECVDTLSHLRKTGLLGAETSVDTATGCVDTLSQDSDPVSTPSMDVSTLP